MKLVLNHERFCRYESMRYLFIISMFLWSAVSYAQAPWQVLSEKLKGPKVASHQGEIWGLYQNTIKAFQEAKNKGADIVEMDLRATRDGVAVVFHDESLGVWTNCRGNVADKTFEELSKCHFRFNSEKIPTFEEVLQWAGGKILVNAEFKDNRSIAPALALVKKYQAHNWVYFQAQYQREKYELARSLDSDVVLLYVLNNEDDLNWFLIQPDPALLIAEVNQNSRNPTWISRIHGAGKLVSEDSFNYSKLKEFFGAACDKVFKSRIDIAVTNRTLHCKRQSQRQY